MAGVGISRQRQAIMSGLRDSVNAFGKEVEGVHSKQVLDLMIVTQYFDMMSSVGNNSKTNAVFMNHSVRWGWDGIRVSGSDQGGSWQPRRAKLT